MKTEQISCLYWLRLAIVTMSNAAKRQHGGTVRQN